MDFGLTLRRLLMMTYFALTLETVSASGIRSTNDMMQMNSLDLSTIFEKESSMEAFLRLENCYELENEDADYSETNPLTFSRIVPSKKRSLTYGAIREAMNANTKNEEADLAINQQFSPEEERHNELQNQLDNIELEDAKKLCNIVSRQMNDLGLDPRKNPALNIFPELKEHLDVREYVSHPEDDREITTSEKERLDRMKKRSMLKLDLVGDTKNNGKNTISEHEKEILKVAKSYYSDIEALMKKVCEMGERLRNEQYLKEKDTAIKDFCRLKDELKDQFDSEVFDLKNFRMIFDNLMVYKDRFAKLEQDSAMGKSNLQKLNDLSSISDCSKAMDDQTHATECGCEDLERNKLILGHLQGEK